MTIRAIDLFAGGGGTSTGVALACRDLGKKVELVAINHWDKAIETHSANHPWATHICARVESLDPRVVVPDGTVNILAASPECTHFSRAAGGRPKNDQKRASAWDVLRWLELLDVKGMMVENVPEFAKWGELDEGKPIRHRKGRIFQSWMESIRAHGYNADYRVLNAADYGAATSRSRLFVLARKGDLPITWPVPTHSKKPVSKVRKWRAAREIIDWELKGESIFSRKKPLSPMTVRRIVEGLRKFSGVDFILPPRGYFGQNTPKSLDQPLGTVTQRGGGHLVMPFLIPYRSERDAQTPRTHSLDEPCPTIATSNNFGLVQPCLVQYNGTSTAQSVQDPLGTVTTRDRFALVEPYLVRFNGSEDALSEDSKRAWRNSAKSLEEPIPAVTGRPRFGLAEPFIVRFNGTDEAGIRKSPCSLDDPTPTIVASSDHLALVEPELREDLRPDIRFRMLQPHELSAAMGFPDGYQFAGTKTEVIKQIGNAVVVDVARALATSLLSPHRQGRLSAA